MQHIYTTLCKRFILFLLFTGIPALVISSEDDPISNGANTFEIKCASCHGHDALGESNSSQNGEVNAPNLRKISERNNGQFPVSRIYAVIDGREIVEGHGTRVMPVWGDLFLSDTIWEGCSQVEEQLVRGRIMELILYLDSIQE